MTVVHTTIPLSSIISNPANYIYHPPEQIEDLKASLRRFGQVENVVVKAVGGHYMLVAGEGITTAAKALLNEDERAYAHLLSFGATIVPDEWTQDDVQGYMVASNETKRRARVNDERLNAILTQQASKNFDLRGLGASDEFIAGLKSTVEKGRKSIEEKLPKESPFVAPKPAPIDPIQVPIPEMEQPSHTLLRQIVLVVTKEQYEDMLTAFSAIRTEHDLATHADCVRFLLERYKDGRAAPTDR